MMNYLSYSVICCFLLVLASCQTSKKESKPVVENLPVVQLPDSLFRLDIINNENFVRITIPEGIDFELPDSFAKTEPEKYADFNGDNKLDLMVHLGACGTGGCMYGIFLNQYDNYYKLVFMDYLKGATFEKDENGFLSFQSYEEAAPMNPSKLYVTSFKFDPKAYAFKIDKTFIQTN
ncbi:hypothetical protein Celal_4053 [Cellulophaga algicola DSM 14237]|uniref:Uncharacterized protein n=1 Tax=Cellulophaga algicola (strain DSM 14237 / IC166 / ACAM 630) TaxID=688270 RepID=E6XDV8_CELAD|nr:hypothetical protein [Cellulophaga algicola]ADV51296.1 hypothetical protein Celal_4053 [Cellulophaga algicola DSM 14237]